MAPDTETFHSGLRGPQPPSSWLSQPSPRLIQIQPTWLSARLCTGHFSIIFPNFPNILMRYILSLALYR